MAKASLKELVAQARKATFILLKRTNQFYSMTLDVIRGLYEMCIEPILNYGSKAWRIPSVTDAEKFHLWFCELILNVKQNTIDCIVYKEFSGIY